MHHDLFSFTKTGEHFVLFGLDCWVCIYIIQKKSKIEILIKIFL